MEEMTELQKAVKVVQDAGHKVIHGRSLCGHDYIREVSDLLDAAGYRVVSAEAVRPIIGGWREWDGELRISILPNRALEKEAGE